MWKVKKQSHRGRAETRSGTTLVEGQGACTVWAEVILHIRAPSPSRQFMCVLLLFILFLKHEHEMRVELEARRPNRFIRTTGDRCSKSRTEMNMSA